MLTLFNAKMLTLFNATMRTFCSKPLLFLFLFTLPNQIFTKGSEKSTSLRMENEFSSIYSVSGATSFDGERNEKKRRKSKKSVFAQDMNEWRDQMYPEGRNFVRSLGIDGSPEEPYRQQPLTAKWLPVKVQSISLSRNSNEC